MENQNIEIKSAVKEEKSIDIRAEISKSLSNINRPVIIGELVDELIRKGKAAGVELNAKTIRGKIDKLKEEDELIKISPENRKNYGIDDSNKKHVYVAAKEFQEIRERLNVIFGLLKSQRIEDIALALKELRHLQTTYFGKCYLTSEQLNALVDILGELKGKALDNNTIRIEILKILFDEITINKVEPSDKTFFLETIQDILNAYLSPAFLSGQESAESPLKYTIDLLGTFRDKVVIDKLMAAAKTYDPSTFRAVARYYKGWHTAKVIEENRIELSKLEVELRKKKGKEEIIDAIEEIKDMAADWIKSFANTPQGLPACVIV
jgi:hypothetical protein